jgi:hypothetical protein
MGAKPVDSAIMDIINFLAECQDGDHRPRGGGLLAAVLAPRPLILV